MTTTNPTLPTLPEPHFRLVWRDGSYFVSKPDIDSSDCYTADQMHAYLMADRSSLLDAHASALRDAEKLRKALTTLCRHFPTDADMVEAGWDAATVSSACDAYDSARAAALDDNTKGAR